MALVLETKESHTNIYNLLKIKALKIVIKIISDIFNEKMINIILYHSKVHVVASPKY